MEHPAKSSLRSQEPPKSAQRLGDAQLSCTQEWVLGRSQRDGSSEGVPAPPALGGKWPWRQQPGRLNATAVSWQGHSGRDLPGGRLILRALRRGYFGPFALCESPAIFQPHGAYFRGSGLHRLGQCCCPLPRGLEPKAMLGPQTPPSRVQEAAQVVCRGSQQLPCGTRDVHSSVDQHLARPTSLPPS